MAAVFRKVHEFDSMKEEWTQYIERLEHFLVASDIADAGKKRAVLMSVVGASTYALKKPCVASEKSYSELVAVLKEHYNPTPLETV